MSKDDLSSLYDGLIKKGYMVEDIGDENTFRTKMADKANRKQLYDYVSGRGDFRIGDYDSYERRLTGTGAEEKIETPKFESDMASSEVEAMMNDLRAGIEQAALKKEKAPSLKELAESGKGKADKVSAPMMKEQVASVDAVRHAQVIPAVKHSTLNDEEKDIDRTFKPRTPSSVDDVMQNYSERFALTGRGQELGKELNEIQTGVTDKYAKEFLKSDAYKELQKRYEGDELDKKANEAFQDAYAEQIENDMRPYMEAYQGEMMNRYGERVKSDIHEFSKEAVGKHLQALNKDIDQLLEKNKELLEPGGLRPFVEWTGRPGGVSIGENIYKHSNKELNEDYRKLIASKRLLEDAQTIVNEASRKGKTNFVSGLGRGVADAVFDADTWSGGVLSMVNEGALLDAVVKYDKGENLTHAEQQLLDAAATNMAANAYYASDLGRGYKAGKTTGQSVPFMLEFAINPISGSGNALAKGILKYALKRFGSRMAKKGVSKMAARLAGDALAAAGMTGTTGAPRVVAGGLERQTGDVKFDMDNEGHFSYAGRENQLSAGEALAKSAASTFLENQSEMVFNAFKGFGPAVWGNVQKHVPGGVTAVMDNAVLGKAGEIYRKIKTNPVLVEAARRTQFHGLGEEYLEEVYNNFANIPLGEMTLEEATDLDNNIDTFLGLAPTSVAFGMLGLGGLAHEKYQHRKKMRHAFGQMNRTEQEKLAKLEELAAQNGNEDIKRFIKETIASTELTPEEKKSEISYAYDIAVNNAMNDLEAEQEKEIGENESSAIQEGRAIYAEHDPKKMRETVVRREVAQQRLSDAGLSDEEINQLGNTPVAERQGLLSGYDESMRNMAMDYLNAADREKALNDALDEAHEEEVAQARQTVGEITMPNGMVTIVPLGKYGTTEARHGVVVNGIGADGMPTQSNGALMVRPIRMDAEGRPLFASIGTDEPFVMVPESYTEVMTFSPEDAFSGMLVAYQADADILEETPIAPQAVFSIMADDGTVQEVTVLGNDGAGNRILQMADGSVSEPMPEGELRERKRNAERASIMQEYAMAEQIRNKAKEEVESTEYAPEIRALEPRPGDKLVVNGRDAVITELSADGLNINYVNEGGDVIGADQVPKDAFYQYKQGLHEASVRSTSQQAEQAQAQEPPQEQSLEKQNEDEKETKVVQDYPRDKNGEPLFTEMYPEETVSLLQESMGDEAGNFVKDKLAEAKKRAEKASKKKAKSTSFNERLKELDAIKQEKEAADKDVAYWEGVTNLRNSNIRRQNEGVYLGNLETDNQADINKITPIGESDFGFVYDQFRGDAEGAIRQLMKMQGGEALGALHHKDIGDIDLVWGKTGTKKSDGYGLSKLVKYHPEVLGNLQGILEGMHITKRSDNRIQLEDDIYQAAVRLTWNGEEKLWLLTAFKKKETPEPTNSRTDVDSNLNGKLDDTTTQQSSDVSVNKDTKKPSNEQTGTVNNQSLTNEEAHALIKQMEGNALPAPELELTPENWVKEFGEDGVVETPIGRVKMGEHQFDKLTQQGRNGKLGMIKPTLETPNLIIEDHSKAKEGDTTERESSFVFVKAFVKSNGSRYYYFTSVTVSKEGNEVVISNQEKRRNVIKNLLMKGKLIWKHADDVSSASDVADGLYSSQGNMSDPTTEGTDAPQTNSLPDDKDSEKPSNEQTGTVNNQSLTNEEAHALIKQMEENAVPAPELELTPENWVKEFGEDAVVETPIGKVKMGENQFIKLTQNGRNGKLGMVKPTLKHPDIIVEDVRPSNDGKQERASSFIFIKTFKKRDGSRYYHFTSVTVSKDGQEIVISNQERSANRISKLLQQSKVTWINDKFSLHPTTQIKESVPLNDSNKLTSTDSQLALLGINSSEPNSVKDVPSVFKDTQKTPNEQIGTNINVKQEVDRLSPKRKRIRYVKEDAELGEAVLPEEYVLREIATGRITFKWNDTKGGKGLGSHLGLADSQDERKKLIWALSTDGMIPEAAAEAIHADMPERLQGMVDDWDVFNLIIKAFHEYGTPSRMMEAARQMHGENEETSMPGYDADMERQRLEWEAEQNRMSVQDWMTYQGIVEEEIDKYFSSLSDEELNTIFEQIYDQLQQEEYERRRNEETSARGTEESTNDTGGNEVLPEQRRDNTRTGEELPRPDVQAQIDEQGSDVVSEQGAVEEAPAIFEFELIGDETNDVGDDVEQPIITDEKTRTTSLGEKIAEAEKQVDKNPTEAQKEAGNYKKGHVQIGEFDVTIEQPKGSVRRGVDANGNRWETTMRNTYGYIRGTEGVDGDHIDVFLSDDMDGWNGRRVFVVDQYNEDGSFDEHKVMLGFNDEAEVQDAYLGNYEKGWGEKRKIVVTSVNLEDFEKWIESSHRKTKPFAEYKSVKALRTDNQGNPIHADGSLLVETVQSIADLTDEDFSNPQRSVQLPPLPANVDEAIGANGKPVVVKKSIFEKNKRDHVDLKPSQSREIFQSALYSPDLYGQNQKRKRPYNWIVVNTKDEAGHNRLVLLEVNEKKENIEIVHWHYVRDKALETVKRQAEREGGLILILPSGHPEEAGGLSSRTQSLPFEDKNNQFDSEKLINTQKTSDVYTIEPTPYTTKRGKVLDMHLVTFADALDKETQRNAMSMAKEMRGWYDRERKGFMMRSEEDARKLAEAVAGTGEKLADASSLSLNDMKQEAERNADVMPDESQKDAKDITEPEEEYRKSLDSTYSRLKETLEGKMPNVKALQTEMGKLTRNINRIEKGAAQSISSDEQLHETEVAIERLRGRRDAYKKVLEEIRQKIREDSIITEEAAGSEQAKVNPSGNKLVTDERYAELRERMRMKLRGQMNMGIDPEILAIGTEMAVYHIEKGARAFADYAKAMIGDLGDAIRPYLKAFYNGARELPEVEDAGFTADMTPYEEVRTFDVANFDKDHVNVVNTAKQVTAEQKAEQQAEEGKAKLKERRNKRMQTERKLRPATEADLKENPVVFYKGNGYRILMLEHAGEQLNAAQFSEPRLTGIVLHDGTEVQLGDLMVEDKGGDDSKVARKNEAKEKKSDKKQVTSQGQDKGLFDNLFDNQTSRENERKERRSEEKDSGMGEETRPEDGRADRTGMDRGSSGSIGTEQLGSGRDAKLPASPGTGSAAGKTTESGIRNARNNHNERGVDYAPRSPKARFEANIRAIKLMRELIGKNAVPTSEQMDVLRKHSGWGGLGTFFNNEDSAEYKKLRELLSEEEFDAAVNSINSAYYTPAKVMDALWDVVGKLGFKGGNILEGSAGIGNIIGSMPVSISEQSNIEAVEIDSISGNILSLLYPDAKVHVRGFEETPIRNGSVDLAITNVPFVTGLSVYDKIDKDLSKKFRNIHDFCIAKNVRKLREGGIGVFISSSGTLDKSTALREWLVGEGNADVIGAFRLNNETFGGTNATSDIIIVRKRVGRNVSPDAIDVLSSTIARRGSHETGEKVWDKKTRNWEPEMKEVAMEYNTYFQQHPENMGGEMFFGYEKGDTYRPGSAGLYPAKGKEQDRLLSEWVDSFKLLADGNNRPQQTAELKETEEKNGTLIADEKGDFFVSDMGAAVPLDINKNKVRGYEKTECLNDYNALKSALDSVLAYQISNQEDKGLEPLLAALNEAYDNFFRKYGSLNKNTSIAFLRNDVDFPSVAAAEKYSETKNEAGEKTVNVEKTEVFNGRVIGFQPEPRPKTVKDGVIASIYKFGNVNLGYIAGKLEQTPDQVRETILDENIGFVNPVSGAVEVRHEYLSGNVREKLEQAKANNQNGEYDKNIRALEEVLPMDIPAHLIDFSLGSSWIDPKLYMEFIESRYGVGNVKLNHVEGLWNMETGFGFVNEKNRAAGVYSEVFQETTYGTTLVEAALNNRTVVIKKVITHADKSKETLVDKDATQACTVRIAEIKDEFKEWMRNKMLQDEELATKVMRTYNDKFNNLVPKTIDEMFLPAHFGGTAEYINLYPHQKKAVIRGTTEPLLLAHEVGSGKTFTLISTAMEMRRLGTAKKPMIVVQNATVGQFVSEAKKLYPNARILTITDKDRTPEGRRTFYGRIKYSDWDMVVIPQSTFEMIPDSPERQLTFIQERIEDKQHAIEVMRETGADENDLKRLENELNDLGMEYDELAVELQESSHGGGKKKKDAKSEEKSKQKVIAKAKEQLDRRTDEVQYFDETGVDAILIDEAHEYKRLGFSTAMTRGVKGIDPAGSKKAAGVYLKTRAVLEQNGWKNVVFATGTPISNTAAEIWTFMKYLMPKDVMKANEIYYFDDFVRNFGSITQSLEFATNGKFKENTRFAAYINKPELIRLWASVSDTVLTKEIKYVNDKIPRLETDKHQDVFLPQSDSLISIMNAVREELERFEDMSGKEKRKNSHIPLTMYGIAKRAAIDPRLVDANAPDEPLSKTNKAVEETLRSLKETESYKGTVAIFCDNQRRWDGNKVGFDLFEDIRSKLIAAGVPESQIVVMKAGMSIPKKEKIFADVNAGNVRVIIGNTQTLGTGVNIQERLHTLIHMDAPDRPMDYTQRNGRILRQGNLHKQWDKPVRILRFGVEDSLDVTSYQRLKTKAAFIDSIMDGKAALANNQENRTLEEEEEGLFDNPVAILSGSQYALLKNAAERDYRKWLNKQKQYEADQIYIVNRLRRNAGVIASNEQDLKDNHAFLATAKELWPEGKPKTVTIAGKVCKDAAETEEAFKELVNKPINARIEEARNDRQFTKERIPIPVKLDDVEAVIYMNVVKSNEYDHKFKAFRTSMKRNISFDIPALDMEESPVAGAYPKAALDDMLENVVNGSAFEDAIRILERSIASLKDENALLEQRKGKPFENRKQLDESKKKVDEYTELMKEEMKEKETKYAGRGSESNVDLSTVESEEESESEVRFRIGNEVNEQFNAELTQQIDGTLPKGHVYRLGMPSDALLSAGLPELPIEMAASRLSDKSMQENHPFDLSEVKNLPQQLQNPMAVFRSATHIGSYVVMTEMEHNGKNFVVAIETNRKRGHIEVNSVRSVHYRTSNTHMANWINEGLLEYVDKKKMAEWLSKQRYNSADVRKLFNHATKVVENFENPKFRLADGDEVNERFNELLDKFSIEEADKFYFDLGMPSFELLSAGVENRPIRLHGSKIVKKMKKHGFSHEELRDLPFAIAHPIAVFDNIGREGNRSILTELKTGNGNFLVTIDLGRGTEVDFDVVSSIFGKNSKGVVDWINKGKMLYVNKEKALDYLHLAAPIAAASDNQELSDATKVVENFENPKFRLADTDEVNERFNAELAQQIDGTLAKGHVYRLGMPSDALLSAGLPELPIEMAANRLSDKSMQENHPFDLSEVKNLPRQLQNPMAVFRSATRIGSYVVLTEMEHNGKNFVVAIQANKKKGRFEVNTIRSVYPKNNRQIANWIEEGLLEYADRKKVAEWLSKQRSNSADVRKLFNHATKIVENFENPIFRTDEINVESSNSSMGVMVSALEKMAEKLHLPVRLVNSVDEVPAGAAKRALEKGLPVKGWYQNGQIYIFLPNATSVEDAQATLLHEGVGHYGLRGMVGMPNFNRFLDRIFAQASKDVRGRILAMAPKYNYNLWEATEEYIATMAESGVEEPSLWEKIKQLFRKMLEAVGVKWEVTDKDLRYLLWESYRQLRKSDNPLDVAKETWMRAKLGIGAFAKDESGETRFRFSDRPVIIRNYDEAVSTNKFRFQEAFQDSMLSFKILQKMIEEQSGLKVRSFEDAYSAENRLSSVNKQDNERYIERFYHPLLEQVALLSNKYDRQQVEDYIYAKSGLERNAVFLLREATRNYDEKKEKLDRQLDKGDITQRQYDALLQTAQADYDQLMAEGKDYAGLEGLAFRDYQDELDDQLKQGIIDRQEYDKQEREIRKEYKSHAEKIVDEFESKATKEEVDLLWKRINDATNETLRKGFESGLLSKEKHDEIKNMMQYYVPMKGWEEQIAEDVYDYTRKDPAVQGNKKAKGRKSLADNPIAQIGLAAQNAIILGNRNKMKQRFFNFVLNRPNELAVIGNVWYEHTNNTVFNQVERVYPDIDEKDDAEAIQQKLDIFEKNMKEKEEEGRAYRGKVPFGMELKLKTGQKPEHFVPVFMNGKEYVIYINGDPRAAQAINGKTNPEGEENIFWEYYNKAKRLYGGGLTSNNPDFVSANFVRDTIHSATMEFLNNGFVASSYYLRNIPKSFTTVVRGVSGRYNPDSTADMYFKEFLENGGETGYTAIHTLEDYKNEYNRMLQELSGIRHALGTGKKGLQAVVKWLETANRVAEDVNRFNAYMSSRQSGKGIEESVNAAKNITVNFNKKGSLGKGKGAWAALAWFMNKWILFFNPAVQGLYQVGQAANKNRRRVAGMLGAIMASGFVMPYLNSLLVAACGGDGDDDYFNQTDYTRMNNWLLYTPAGYVKIPLPPFFREIYGLGDIFHRVLTGKTAPERAAVSSLRQVQSAIGFINLIPEGEPSVQEAVGGLMPDVIAPLMDVAFNRDFTGREIAKDADYTKNLPEYERVYKGVSPVYVEFSRMLNELGGDEARRSPLWGTFINPAYMEHLITSYTGGIGRTVSNVTGAAIDVATGEADNIEARTVPIVNRFINPVTDRTVASAVNRVFHDYMDRYEAVRMAEKRYRQFIKEGRTEFKDELEQMEKNGELEFVRYFKNRLKTLRKKQDRLKDDPKNKELEREIRELKSEMIMKSKEILE